jgi:FMN-dependent NADH-azoreductase
MSQILLVTTSPRGSASYSTQVAEALAAKLTADKPGAKLVVRDLASAPLPHVGEAFVTGRVLPPAERSPAQVEALAPSDAAVAEFVASDVIVIASPMYNFGVPSSLKAWIDHLVRPGLTFSYGANGAEGLVKGKKAYLVEARGGIYADEAAKGLNFQEPYLKTVLGFIGVTDVDTIAIEGIGYGPEAVEKALNGALGKVAALAA